MGNVIELFTSFRGRISRRSWWLGLVVYLILSVAGTLVLNPNALNLDPDFVAPPVWADTIWQLVLIIPLTAITVKRFNDREWPNCLGYACGVIAALFTIAPHFGYLSGSEISMNDTIGIWAYLSALLIVFINNGFLPGTPGPNRYGPDPLQST